MRIMSDVRKSNPSRQPFGVGQHFKERPVRLSGDAHRYRQIARMVQQLPDVRRQRINTVRQKLHSGQYEIDSRHLVELILEAAQDTRRDYRAAA
ncbi:MAG: flagellar biosynthesis anti-sigma factor FlgM [Armatimonadetes bacterium]|nr:flagellar biosynthesis anti-sigma factor FlgM [Armatimonadota bacterium]